MDGNHGEAVRRVLWAVIFLRGPANLICAGLGFVWPFWMSERSGETRNAGCSHTRCRLRLQLRWPRDGAPGELPTPPAVSLAKHSQPHFLSTLAEWVPCFWMAYRLVSP